VPQASRGRHYPVLLRPSGCLGLVWDGVEVNLLRKLWKLIEQAAILALHARRLDEFFFCSCIV
jgi:hypothetical protein